MLSGNQRSPVQFLTIPRNTEAGFLTIPRSTKAGLEQEEQPTETNPRPSIISSMEQHMPRRALRGGVLRRKCSFGAWVIVQSTRPQIALWRRLLWPLFANLVDFSLFLLLIMSAAETIHPPCIGHDDCRQGEWCVPTLRGLSDESQTQGEPQAIQALCLSAVFGTQTPADSPKK